MQPLAAAFLARLERGEPDRETLRRVGESDPDATAATFLRATREPELAATREVWVPALLRSARPGFGAQCLTELAQKRRAAGCEPLDLNGAPALPLVLGSSNFLARLLLRHPRLGGGASRGSPPAPTSGDRPDRSRAGRRFDSEKYRGLLAGRGARSHRGDRVRGEPARALGPRRPLSRRRRSSVPRSRRRPKPPRCFALGKLGGRELNFASDVDLLFVYDALDLDEDDLEAESEPRSRVSMRVLEAGSSTSSSARRLRLPRRSGSAARRAGPECSRTPSRCGAHLLRERSERSGSARC